MASKFGFLLLLFVSLTAFAQDTAVIEMSPEMRIKSDEVEAVISKMFEARDVERRLELNDSLLSALTNLFEMREAMKYPEWDFPGIALLRDSKQKLAILTWELTNTFDEYIYFGMIAQDNDGKKNDIYTLLDSSETIQRSEYKKLNDEHWYGAMYYEMREVKFKKKNYITLLGMRRKGSLLKERMVEILFFDNGPKFGMEVFEFDGKLLKKRLLYPHSSETSMSINFESDELILMDHLSPSEPIYEGKFEYYVPDLSFDALELKKGIWHYEADYDARLRRNLKDRYYEMPLPKQDKLY